MVTHLKKSDFMKTIHQLKGSAWSDISNLGYSRWFYFCKVTGRMWVLPLRYDGVAHGRWVVPSTKNVPHYSGGEFRGWGSLTDIENDPETDTEYKVKPPLELVACREGSAGYEEVIIDDD